MKKEEVRKIGIVALGFMLVISIIQAIEILINAIGFMMLKENKEISSYPYSNGNDYFLKAGLSNLILAFILLAFLAFFILYLIRNKKIFKLASFALMLATILACVAAIVFSSLFKYETTDYNGKVYIESNYYNLANFLGVTQLLITELVLIISMFLIRCCIIKDNTEIKEIG